MRACVVASMPTPARHSRAARQKVRSQPARQAVPSLETLEATLRDWLGEVPLLPPARPRGGRPPVLPATLLWTGLLVCILRGFSAQLELWRLLTQWGLWHYPRVDVSDMAVYQRLARTPPTAMQAFFTHLSAVIAAHQTAQQVPPAVPLAAFAMGIFALDQMVLDPVLRHLKLFRGVPVGAHALLPGVLTCVFDVRRQQWQHVTFSPNALQNEKPGAPAMVADLPPGSLLLFDLGYFSFPWFDHLTHAGFYFVSRWRQKTSLVASHVLYEGTHGTVQLREVLGYLGKHAADRAAYPVRLIEITHGAKTYRYLTNVLDPRLLPAWEVVALYQARWDIEKAFDLLKTHLGLHLLWSGHTHVLLHQVFATLALAQVVLALRAEIARQAQADVREVSLSLMLRWLPRLAADGHDPVALFVARGRAARCIRPFRSRDYDVPRLPTTAYDLPERAPPRRPARYNRAGENPQHAALQRRLNALPPDTGTVFTHAAR